MGDGPVPGVLLVFVQQYPSDRVAFHRVALHVFGPFAASAGGCRKEFCAQGITICPGYKQAQMAKAYPLGLTVYGEASRSLDDLGQSRDRGTLFREQELARDAAGEGVWQSD
jgi:hypothetical protein